MARLRVLLLLVLLSFSACQSPEKNSKEAVSQPGFVKVTHVIDGDTFDVEDSTGQTTRIRFIGLDAPESRKTPKEDVQFYGKEAKEYLKQRLKGQQVRLVNDVEPHDKYGRTLAYVYLTDGTFLNAELVEQGYAEIMTIPPNVAHADEFLKLQQEARENKRGMWQHQAF
ncbi:MAG: thermonuclease family protein [Chitinophagales bacterium]